MKKAGILTKKVICLLFQCICETNLYNVIWCHASLLHVISNEYKSVFEKLKNALKQGGVIFMCFKYGEYDGVDSYECFKALNLEGSDWEVEKIWVGPCTRVTVLKRPDWFFSCFSKIIA